MKVAGFSFVRNAQKNNYPFLESIRSILPLCDKFYIVVGDSDDNTLEAIKQINSPKIEIILSVWDKKFYENGSVYAVETNKAFDAIPKDFDWCFYIQADECLHENDYDIVRQTMQRYNQDDTIDCLVFQYKHFYGSYDYIADSRRWYRREIRIIKNDKSIRSYLDAQGFRRGKKKLRGKIIDAYIYHYGWVKLNTSDYCSKFVTQRKYYANQEENPQDVDFHYDNVDRIRLFKGTHPTVMSERIENQNKRINFSPTKIINKMKWSKKILQWIEDVFGLRFFEFKNYKSV